MKKVVGITVDPSTNEEKEGIDFMKIPVYSQEPDEDGFYNIVGYVKESLK